MYLRRLIKPIPILIGLALIIIASALTIPFNEIDGQGIARFFGRFHVLVLHFPITLIVLIPILEFFVRKKSPPQISEIILFIWWFASFSVFVTVMLGMTLASNEGFGFEQIQTHLTAGICVALITFICTALKHTLISKTSETGENPKNQILLTSIYTTSSIALLIILFFAAHAGGNLVHGETYLTRFAPDAIKSWLPEDATAFDLSESNDEVFVQTIQPLFDKYCYSCHGDEKQKGGVQISALNPDFVNGYDAPQWHAILDMINSGEMPPPKEHQLSTEERRAVVDWLTNGIATAKEMKKGSSKQVMQRLTKQQYSNTLQDLLGVSVNFESELPDDPLSEIGFSNNAELLSTSNLHLETFQKIARSALDKAINLGDKPAVSHYRMHFGKGIGKSEPNTLTKGYMEVAVAKNDFYVEVLDENGQAKNGQQVEQIKPYFSASLRGSNPRRFKMMEDGITLYSALPHKETTQAGRYGAWNGPSPNLSMQIKDQYPRNGDFAIRVKASKGYAFDVLALNAKSLTKAKPLAELDKNNTSLKKPAKGVNRFVVLAKNAKKTIGFEKPTKETQILLPSPNSKNVSGEIVVQAPARGGDYFQIDLVHPALPKGVNSHINLQFTKDIGFNTPLVSTDKSTANNLVVSSIGVAYLVRGDKLKVAFSSDQHFPGFSHLVFTKLKANHKHVKNLPAKYLDNSQFEDAVPEIMPYIGTRTDDGMDYKTFTKSVRVENIEDNQKVFSFYGRLENLPIPFHGTQGDHITSSSLKVGLWNNNLVKSSDEFGSPLHIDYIEFEAPYFKQWPTQAHQKIFIESANKNNPEVYANEVITQFVSNAYRRPATAEEVMFYFNYWQNIKDDYSSFEESIKETLVAVLCSTNFLFIYQADDEQMKAELTDSVTQAAPVITTSKVSDETTRQMHQYALASRLSYFLWNSPPDNELLMLAKNGQLESQLETQMKRMINDDKVMRFIDVFTSQWLRLDRQKNQSVDIATYPDYTRFIKQDMALETQHFIRILLQENLPALNLVKADFTMLNQNLAEFYGIEEVRGSEFVKVLLGEDNARGGLLSQGTFLTGHADGVHSHPVKRAVWLKEKILGDSPPPPPPNVPELDPDTPGFENLTLKQQLELHRDKDSCRDCHAKIDPFGVVFEKYDAVGRLRASYKGGEIDDSVVLPDGTKIKGTAEIKQYLVTEQKDKVVLSLIKHLYAYALAKEVSFHDEDALNAILTEVKNNQYQMQSIITSIIRSPAFVRAPSAQTDKPAPKLKEKI